MKTVANVCLISFFILTPIMYNLRQEQLIYCRLDVIRNLSVVIIPFFFLYHKHDYNYNSYSDLKDFHLLNGRAVFGYLFTDTGIFTGLL
jgi:hypothetical protein